MSQLRKEVNAAKGTRADLEVSIEELRGEVARLGNVIEERAQFQNLQTEALRKDLDASRKEMEALSSRVQALEQKPAVEPEKQPPEPPAKPPAADFDAGKRLFDSGKYSEAADVLKGVVKKTPSVKDKKARFLLAESYFSSKQWALAALEFREYQKRYGNDPQVPKAIFRQAQSFKNMGKKKEARLFYKELVDKYPKSQFSKLAEKELK